MRKSIYTLEKIQRLERYINSGNFSVDTVLDIAIEKLLAREITRMLEVKERLTDQLESFEKQYSLKSSDFYIRYENGEMGDEMDFIEWASTVEMLANL
ncbi:MAG: hypothetical protein GY795_12435 [Desulfobacterales bacterium]|nr:hypothetical protein [Desulfobacterales bacterium]